MINVTSVMALVTSQRCLSHGGTGWILTHSRLSESTTSSVTDARAQAISSLTSWNKTMTILSPATREARRENLPAVLASERDMNPARTRAARCVALEDQLIKIAVFLDPLGKLVVAHSWTFDVRSLSFAVLASARSADDIVESLRAKPRIDDDRPEVIPDRLQDMLAEIPQVKDGISIGHIVDTVPDRCL